ncbi:sensor histidine kinase [Sphingobium lactosutens]|nr:sensor histidine kinase [Sphingobium lactosutens]
MSRRSLKWRLINSLVIWQALILLVLIAFSAVSLAYMWSEGALGDSRGRAAYEAVSEAVSHDATGRLDLRPSHKLDRLRKEIDGFWFLVRDARGQSLAEGRMPDDARALLPVLDHIEGANVGHLAAGNFRDVGSVAIADTRAGRVRILADNRGSVTFSTVLAIARTNLMIGSVFVLLMAVTTLIVTPFVVRRALAGLDKAAGEAEQIDIKRAGVRLTTRGVFREIKPLVIAVNEALDRLDQGYERHKRFLADAAHELRTPIAILSTRVSSLPTSDTKLRLLQDAARLTVLADQLLDLQRLDGQELSFSPVDLVTVAERVIVNLSPLAFAAGYEIDFDSKDATVSINGDESAIERVITNLVQNAIDHGGQRGSISLCVSRPGVIEICDDGDGIPESERESIFDPFRRLKRGGRGAGLGLDLVQRIMRMHGGFVDVVPREGRGACMRLCFNGND